MVTAADLTRFDVGLIFKHRHEPRKGFPQVCIQVVLERSNRFLVTDGRSSRQVFAEQSHNLSSGRLNVLNEIRSAEAARSVLINLNSHARIETQRWKATADRKEIRGGNLRGSPFGRRRIDYRPEPI